MGVPGPGYFGNIIDKKHKELSSWLGDQNKPAPQTSMLKEPGSRGMKPTVAPTQEIVNT
jgi:hypothetical protein